MDSEFLTTYKYSNADYTRKYLGLTQTRKLIETFPYKLTKSYKTNLNTFIKTERFDAILNILNQLNVL